MKITFLGQAGLFIETRHGSILCDPWFNPAYFASWFPFPSNEEVDREKLSRPTYLYVSHMHHDHFDPQFLSEHVSKEATVLLPDYPLDLLERSLRELGAQSDPNERLVVGDEDAGHRTGSRTRTAKPPFGRRPVLNCTP